MLALGLLVSVALAAEPEKSEAKDDVATKGAAVAPAALPAGSIAFWGLLGAPEVAVGYRQGFSLLEFEASARFHYLEVSGTVEAGVRIAAWKRERTIIAPTASIGFKANSGVRAFDPYNFRFFALRPKVGLVTSIALSEVVQVSFSAELPWAIALNVTGFQFTPTVGAGAEFSLSPKLSLAGQGQIGIDVVKEPLGVATPRVAWAVRFGVGYRLF